MNSYTSDAGFQRDRKNCGEETIPDEAIQGRRGVRAEATTAPETKFMKMKKIVFETTT